MTGDIVVGLDGSECAEAALRHAISLARALEVGLVIVYSAEPPFRSVGEEYREHLRALEEIGGSATTAAVEEARGAGVAAEAVVIDEKPAEGLVRVAEERGASMIVVGTWSERPIRGAILGSVPFKLLHQSSVPVVAVPLP